VVEEADGDLMGDGVSVMAKPLNRQRKIGNCGTGLGLSTRLFHLLDRQLGGGLVVGLV
jgi:hypothetical protein